MIPSGIRRLWEVVNSAHLLIFLKEVKLDGEIYTHENQLNA